MMALNISEVGRRAYIAGLKASDNPFKIGSAARSLWAKGYNKEARAVLRNLTPTEVAERLAPLIAKAETGEQWADICAMEAALLGQVQS